MLRICLHRRYDSAWQDRDLLELPLGMLQTASRIFPTK